jgi:hypothetical protein
MSNPKFLGVDLTKPTYAWKTTAGVTNDDPAYPVDNLKTYFPDNLSKTTGTASGLYLMIDMASAVACNMLVIHGHNIAAALADTISLEADDNSGFATPEVIIAAITIASADEIVLETFATKTYRYWRVVFDVAGVLLTPPSIGNIFLGTSLDFESTQQWGFNTNVPASPKTTRIRSLDNRLRTASVGNDIRKHSISFDERNSQSDTLITAYLLFLAATHNGSVPFYYIDNTGAVYLVNFEKDYNPYKAFRYNMNTIPDLLMESTMADS